MKRLLIISNNVLSSTNNNGKTILSFIEGIESIEVAQIYFSGEKPKIEGYNYFQISDKDIIRGVFNRKKRGRCYRKIKRNNQSDDFSIRKTIGRNDFTLVARDLLWFNKWKSKHLLSWLDSFSPDAILFVAGDSLFAYSICDYVQKRFKAKLSVYITDDYIMPRKNENMIHFIRRKAIIKHLKRTLKMTSTLFTISEPMRQTYKRVLKKDSSLLFNLVEDMYDESYEKKETEIILTYAGSFYYKRSEILSKVARAIKKYNSINECKQAKLLLYSNEEPEENIKRNLIIPGVSEYGGSLTKEQLKERLNTSDILVFVESFEPEQVEKVKYSFSTKVPEYLSIGKPILAIGPKEIGSMKYLEDCAFCVYDDRNIIFDVSYLLSHHELYAELSEKSRIKYISKHNSKNLKNIFIELVM